MDSGTESSAAKIGDIFEKASDQVYIAPRDLLEKYGSMEDWRVAAGTGPT